MLLYYVVWLEWNVCVVYVWICDEFGYVVVEVFYFEYEGCDCVFWFLLGV